MVQALYTMILSYLQSLQEKSKVCVRISALNVDLYYEKLL